jgi:hypothetical protein
MIYVIDTTWLSAIKWPFLIKKGSWDLEIIAHGDTLVELEQKDLTREILNQCLSNCYADEKFSKHKATIENFAWGAASRFTTYENFESDQNTLDKTWKNLPTDYIPGCTYISEKTGKIFWVSDLDKVFLEENNSFYDKNSQTR